MDIREIFIEVSQQLQSEFRRTAGIRHSGGKGSIREEALRSFLRQYLPSRYAIGSGEIITPQGLVSGQLDIVIYDHAHCPTLVTSGSHSVFPIESVFGVISVKSTLSSGELDDAYANIESFKSIVPGGSFTHSISPGMSSGLMMPIPVTAVFGYVGGRSLDTISKQVEDLDAKLSNREYRPDHVIVLGEGIIGPNQPLRSEFNRYSLPQDLSARAIVRKTGRHTLFRFYLDLTRELNAIYLKPLDLSCYVRAPIKVGKHLVRLDAFRTMLSPSGETIVMQINANGIEKILAGSKKVTHREHLGNWLGDSVDIEQIVGDDDIYEFNPNMLPPMSIDGSLSAKDKYPRYTASGFQPMQMLIDGVIYAVDLSALSEEDFTPLDDVTIDELSAF